MSNPGLNATQHALRGLFGILCLMALLAAGCSRSADLSASQKLQEAQALFSRAQSRDDFLRAASLYREVLDQGIVNGALLYNLGNAYMQADHRGLAIAAYRQAKRYLPRDPYLDANLKFALGDLQSSEEKQSLLRHVLFWTDWLSYPEKCQFTLLAGALTLLLALVALWAKRPKPWRRGIWIALALTFLCALSTAWDAYRFDYVKNGVITEAEVVARKGNSETYEPSFTETLKEGMEFRVLESRPSWLLIRLREGPEGWIPAGSAAIY